MAWSHCSAEGGVGTGGTFQWVLVPWWTPEAARDCQADAHQGQGQLGASRCVPGLHIRWEQHPPSVLLLKHPHCRVVREGIIADLAHGF